jgi:hypothetical protein
MPVMRILNYKIVSALAVATVLLGGCSPAAESNANANQESESIELVARSGNWLNDALPETIEPTWLSEEVVEKLTDEFGSYSRTKTSYPDTSEVVNLGLQTRELESALKFFTDFVMLEVLDSPALDNNAAYKRWVESSAPKFIDPDRFDSVVRAQDNGRVFGVIFNNFGPLSSMGNSPGTSEYMIPRLVRDGGPRVLNKKIWGIEAAPAQGGVHVRGLGSAALITTTRNLDLQSFEYFLAGAHTRPPSCFTDQGDIISGCNEGQMDYEVIFPLRFQIGLYLTPSGDSWKISSFSSYFHALDPGPYAPSNGTYLNPDFLLELRQNLKQG